MIMHTSKTRLQRLFERHEDTTYVFSAFDEESVTFYTGYCGDIPLLRITRKPEGDCTVDYELIDAGYGYVDGSITVQEHGNFSSGECLEFLFGGLSLYVPNTFEDFERLVFLAIELLNREG